MRLSRSLHDVFLRCSNGCPANGHRNDTRQRGHALRLPLRAWSKEWAFDCKALIELRLGIQKALQLVTQKAGKLLTFVSPTRRGRRGDSSQAMERPAPCPRVNFSLMEKFMGQHVLLVCKLVEIDPTANRAHVLTSDGGKVIVALKATAFDSTYVEFEGIVDAPNQLREEARCEFGSNFDMTTYDRLCQLSNTDYRSLCA